MWMKPRGYKDPKAISRVYLEELTEAAEADSEETLDALVFSRNTHSIRPVLYYSKPLDDVMYCTLNLPHMKFVFV
jgi:hypothetical protein